jgi:hypothetical protein
MDATMHTVFRKWEVTVSGGALIVPSFDDGPYTLEASQGVVRAVGAAAIYGSSGGRNRGAIVGRS